jgi:hypothetical protein
MSKKLSSNVTGVALTLIGSASLVSMAMLVYEQQQGTDLSKHMRESFDKFTLLNIPSQQESGNQSKSENLSTPKSDSGLDARMAAEGRGKGYVGR